MGGERRFVTAQDRPLCLLQAPFHRPGGGGGDVPAGPLEA